MNECERLANELDKALHGGAWHGPSVREALEGVDREAALARPIAAAHTIAEIVLHASTWHDVVRRRLLGESPQVPDEMDWPKADLPDEAAWTSTVARMFETGAALRETVRAFPPEKLVEPRPRVDDTWYGLVSGSLQHILYHAGQIAVLRKAAVPAGKA